MIFRALIAALLSFLTLCDAETLGQPLRPRELGIADIPPCGVSHVLPVEPAATDTRQIQCMFLAVPASGCTLDDVDCVCNSKELTKTLGDCMLANCTMADALDTSRVQADLCNFPKESKRTEVYWCTGAVYVVAIVFVFARFAGKLVSNHLGWDDALVATVLILAAIPTALVSYSTSIGFGNHLWDLEHGRLSQILKLCESFSRALLTEMLITADLISFVVYTFVIGLIKVPVILFYLEIFRVRSFRISAYLLLAYIIVSTITLVFLTIFSCTPVQAFWNRDIGGKCLDIQSIAYATSASAIVQDIILLILPLVFIRNLQMKRSRKIAVGLMFAVGTFGCIATIIRLHALLNFKVTLDPTWDYVIVTIWTELELAATAVCISLPSIRVLLVKILPKRVKSWLTSVTRSTRNRSGGTPKPAMPGSWKQPSSWVEISHKGDDSNTSSKVSRKGEKSRNQITATTSTTYHVRTSDDSDERAAAKHDHDQVELLELETSGRAAQPSARSSSSQNNHITALPPPPPPKIGCLPDEPDPAWDVRRHFGGTDRKWDREDRSREGNGWV